MVGQVFQTLSTVSRHVCATPVLCKICLIQGVINLISAKHVQARRLDMLFVLGGNGTHAGANAIHGEVC